ncbi:MAG: hypothetical protein R3261_01980 [Alphaproteobacteria bacterium]|nr:hypothetical protein [Alphaproteobacteria bacterium]
MDQANISLDIIWWITVVEIPVLGSLFWLNWRNREALQRDIDDLDQRLGNAVMQTRETLSAYKLEVAKGYVTISYLKDVERRITAHLLRIEGKLDKTSEEEQHRVF